MIFAIKGDPESRDLLHSSLQNGEGRFGWSYIPNADLRALRDKLQTGQSLSKDERDCYQPFLLEIKKGDHVVYINVPTWGQCTAARVTGEYFWRHDDLDFNHRFAVDPQSVATFDRNDAIVQPALSARLKLQGRWWRIHLHREFEALLESLKTGRAGKPRTPGNNLALLASEMLPHLKEITKVIHHTHPNYDLEVLMEQVLKRVPGVKEVTRQGGASDHGADLIVVIESGLPIPGLERRQVCVVQVKSYEGDHWDTKATSDIRRAFERYPEAELGLIVSTADASTTALEEELERLRRDTNRPVGLLIGSDVATLLLRFGLSLWLDPPDQLADSVGG